MSEASAIDGEDPVPHIRHLPIPEQIKICAARHCWTHREEKCSLTLPEQGGARYPINWAQWFELRYGETLEQFSKQRKDAANAQLDAATREDR